MDTKHCKRCDRDLPLDQFYERANGSLMTPCKECRRAVSLARYHENPEVRKESMRRWASANPEKVKANRRRSYDANREEQIASSVQYKKDNAETIKDWNLRRKYGMTLVEYNLLLESQGFKCAICFKDHGEGRSGVLHVDHCHKTGQVRGLLCHNCNKGLGCFQDNPDLLRKGADYLEG